MTPTKPNILDTKDVEEKLKQIKEENRKIEVENKKIEEARKNYCSIFLKIIVGVNKYLLFTLT